MPRSEKVRYTLAVSDPGYDGPYLYGGYTDRHRAEAYALQWQNMLRKNGRPNATVQAMAIFPATAAMRDQHWPTR